jgi:hypothetical protein
MQERSNSESQPEADIAPPPYNDQSRSDLSAAVDDDYWDSKRPDDWKEGKFKSVHIVYNTAALKESVKGTMLEKWQVPLGEEWWVHMCITAKNVLRLMRSGFFWSEHNVLRERSFATVNPDAPPGSWEQSRTYVLRDSSEDVQWVGKITVHAKRISSLGKFNLSWLCEESLDQARAFNWDGQLVYRYCSKEPQNAFNVIYDDLPLGGVWPWPKQGKRKGA